MKFGIICLCILFSLNAANAQKDERRRENKRNHFKLEKGCIEEIKNECNCFTEEKEKKKELIQCFRSCAKDKKAKLSNDCASAILALKTRSECQDELVAGCPTCFKGKGNSTHPDKECLKSCEAFPIEGCKHSRKNKKDHNPCRKALRRDCKECFKENNKLDRECVKNPDLCIKPEECKNEKPNKWHKCKEALEEQCSDCYDDTGKISWSCLKNPEYCTLPKVCDIDKFPGKKP